jgi:hypothetical protein
LEGRNEVGEFHDRILYDFGSQDERRVVLWVVDELRDGMFKLERVSNAAVECGRTHECRGKVGRTGD